MEVEMLKNLLASPHTRRFNFLVLVTTTCAHFNQTYSRLFQLYSTVVCQLEFVNESSLFLTSPPVGVLNNTGHAAPFGCCSECLWCLPTGWPPAPGTHNRTRRGAGSRTGTREHRYTHILPGLQYYTIIRSDGSGIFRRSASKLNKPDPEKSRTGSGQKDLDPKHWLSRNKKYWY